MPIFEIWLRGKIYHPCLDRWRVNFSVRSGHFGLLIKAYQPQYKTLECYMLIFDKGSEHQKVPVTMLHLGSSEFRLVLSKYSKSTIKKSVFVPLVVILLSLLKQSLYKWKKYRTQAVSTIQVGFFLSVTSQQRASNTIVRKKFIRKIRVWSRCKISAVARSPSYLPKDYDYGGLFKKKSKNLKARDASWSKPVVNFQIFRNFCSPQLVEYTWSKSVK